MEAWQEVAELVAMLEEGEVAVVGMMIYKPDLTVYAGSDTAVIVSWVPGCYRVAWRSSAPAQSDAPSALLNPGRGK